MSHASENQSDTPRAVENLVDRLKLYVVTDEREDVDSLLSSVREAVLGGATTIQLRRKHDDGRKLVELGHAIRNITHELGALYIVNDRVDVALLTDADGVHVGQSDISCEDVRRLIGEEKIIGVSAATVDEAFGAQQSSVNGRGADYLGVGAIYPTTSKSDADLCGLSELTRIAQSTKLPIVAIGGITLDRVTEVFSAGAHGIAVVSAVMSAENPLHAASGLHARCNFEQI